MAGRNRENRRGNLAITGEIAGVLEKIKGVHCPAVDYERMMMMMMIYIYIYIYCVSVRARVI